MSGHPTGAFDNPTHFYFAVCPAFGSVLARATGSKCIPHSDCLGIDCDISIMNVVTAKIDLSLKVIPDQRKVTITANGETQVVTGDGRNCINFWISALAQGPL